MHNIMSITIESSHPSLVQLPTTFLIKLYNVSAISLQGEEQTKYLQGQVTCDVNNATDTSLIHGAHCNAQGKVFSVFRLINRSNAHLLLQPKTSIKASLAELKKFGVFAKVEIKQTDTLSFYAIVGEQAAEILHQHFEQIPDSLSPVLQVDSTTLVYIAGKHPRYLLINEEAQLNTLIEKIVANQTLPVLSDAIWQLLEVNEGFVQLKEEASVEYVPQMLNLQAIHGISFTKGCYLGQETVARMQYLGRNKRALFLLTGQCDQKITVSDVIEKQLGENWRKAGEILSLYQADNGALFIQAVLSSDYIDETEKKTASLRIKDQPQCQLNFKALPYSLSNEI